MDQTLYLHRNLEYLRKRNGWTYKDLDTRTQISCSTLFRIEKNVTMDPGVLSVVTLANVFEISIDDFIKRDLAKETNE